MVATPEEMLIVFEQGSRNLESNLENNLRLARRPQPRLRTYWLCVQELLSLARLQWRHHLADPRPVCYRAFAISATAAVEASGLSPRSKAAMTFKFSSIAMLSRLVDDSYFSGLLAALPPFEPFPSNLDDARYSYPD